MAQKKKGSTGDYAAANTNEAKLAEIAAARNEAELDEMWKAWDERGWSKEGVMYADLLRRKQDLGVELSGADQRRVTTMAKKEDG